MKTKIREKCKYKASRRKEKKLILGQKSMQLKSGAIGNKSNKTISCFFEETDKIDKPLDTSKERKKEDTHYQFQK